MKWQEDAAPVTEESIAAAISWVGKLTFKLAMSQAGRLDALLEAGKDKTVSVHPWLAPGHRGGFRLLPTQYPPTVLQLILVPSQQHPTKTPSLALKSPEVLIPFTSEFGNN